MQLEICTFAHQKTMCMNIDGIIIHNIYTIKYSNKNELMIHRIKWSSQTIIWVKEDNTNHAELIYGVRSLLDWSEE